MHQKHAQTGRGAGEAVFHNVDVEQFKDMAARIDVWVNKPDNEVQARYCEMLKEVVELKKLNGNFIKLPTNVDDFIADTYAEIWTHATTVEDPTDNTMSSTEHENLSGLREAQTPSHEEKPRSYMSFSNMLNTDGTTDSTTPSARPTPPMPTPAPITTNGEHFSHTQTFTPPKPRPRIISRPMIVKRATDTFTAKPPPKAASPVKQAVSDANTSNVSVVIDAKLEKRPSHDGADDAASPPGSVHDSADDESELSSVNGDQDEDIAPQPPRPRFPSIFGQKAAAPISSKASDGDDDDETARVVDDKIEED